MTMTKLAEYFELEINTLARVARIIDIDFAQKCQYLDRGLGATTLAMMLGADEKSVYEMYEHFKAEIYAIGVDK